MGGGGEELAKERRQRGMDREVSLYEMFEQAGVLGAFERAGEMLLALVLQLRQGGFVGLAHEAKGLAATKSLLK